MNNYLLFVLPALALAFLLYCTARWVLRGGKSKWRYGKNPYRRWCNTCGQQQEVWNNGFSDRWENTSAVEKPCQSHKGATNGQE